MFVERLVPIDTEVSCVETDTEAAKQRLAHVFALFKSFDLDPNVDMSRYLLYVEDNGEEDDLQNEDVQRLAQIEHDAQRTRGQIKAVALEIEDVSLTGSS